jgi:hypothetical protein
MPNSFIVMWVCMAGQLNPLHQLLNGDRAMTINLPYREGMIFLD